MAEMAVPCNGFRWIGQPLTSCDRCGQPYWEHTHEERPPADQKICDLRPMELAAITAERAEACRRKWDTASLPNRPTEG